MSSPEFSSETMAHSEKNDAHKSGSGAFALLRRLIAGERVRVLRELDDFLLRDIGASGDDIWRVHRRRNGERPTLLVG